MMLVASYQQVNACDKGVSQINTPLMRQYKVIKRHACVNRENSVRFKNKKTPGPKDTGVRSSILGLLFIASFYSILLCMQNYK